MKIKILDIPEEGINLTASVSEKSVPEDVWFRKVLSDAYGDDYPQGQTADLDLHILRTADNVQISGTVKVALKPSCDRCLESFDRKVVLPLQMNLAPHKTMHFEEDDEEDGLDEEDVAFSFYKGEEIDLADIVREMLVLDIPIRYVCRDDCKGLCSQCGKNLNLGNCSCVKSTVDPRFAVLKQLRKS